MLLRSRHSALPIGNWIRAGQSGVQIVAGPDRTWVPRSRCLRLITQLHLVTRLGTSRALPLLHLYVSCVCKESLTVYVLIGATVLITKNYTSVSKLRSAPLINRLTPNDPYMGRTTPLTSKRCILYIYSTNIGTEYFKHSLYSPFFFSSKCSLFHNTNLFGSCIIHI